MYERQYCSNVLDHGQEIWPSFVYVVKEGYLSGFRDYQSDPWFENDNFYIGIYTFIYTT